MRSKFILFGRMRVDGDGGQYRLAPLTAAVLARLLIAEGQLVTVAELRQAMWPDRRGPVTRADRVAVQKRVSELRRLLDPDHPGETSLVLRTDRGGVTAYRLAVDRETVDIFRFTDLAAQACAAAPDDAGELWRRALELWRDRPLLDVADREFARDVIDFLQQVREDTEQALAAPPAIVPAKPDPATASAFTAATAAAMPVPRELPLAIRGFAARQGELASLDGLVSAARTHLTAMPVIVLSGMAGVGKTALAVHWAYRVASWFPDGQLYVDLRGFGRGPAMDPGEAIRGFLTALGVPPRHVPDGLQAQTGLYRSMLADRRILVVLDNASDAGQVRSLLPGSARCLTVVTSRDQLAGLAAAEDADLLTLSMLTRAESFGLLESRLGGRRLNAEPDAVEEIITGCAGLPLALAIVAARARSQPDFPLAAIAAELRGSSGILGRLGTSEPDTSVQAAISWSYGRLDPGAARLFRLTGLHPGPDFSPAAAASLVGVPAGHAMPVLAGLARANLLTEHLPGRYTSHDLLRRYAAELSSRVDDDADRRAALGRMLDHYLYTADAACRLINPHRETIALGSPRPGAVTGELTDDRQAHAWLTSERSALQAAARLAADSGFDTHAWQLPWVVAGFFLRQGCWHELATMQAAAVSAATRLGDQHARALAHRGLGAVYALLGRHAEARAELRRALILFELLDDTAGQARTHSGLANVAERQDCPAEALRHDEAALELHRRAGDMAAQARALNAVGWDNAHLGDHLRALACCQEALDLQHKLGDRYGEAETWDSLGYSHYHLSDHEKAATCYRRAIDLYGEVNDRYNQARTLIRYGEVQQSAGDASTGHRTWQEALHILEQLGHPDADELRARLSAG